MRRKSAILRVIWRNDTYGMQIALYATNRETEK